VEEATTRPPVTAVRFRNSRRSISEIIGPP
jgi:hypothetical protein